MAKRWRMSAALAALALAVIGCGSDGDQAAGTASQTGDPVAAPPAGQATTADGSAPGSGDTATAQALASRNATIDANPVRLEIAELRRSGTTVALTLRLSTTSDDTTSRSWPRWLRRPSRRRGRPSKRSRCRSSRWTFRSPTSTRA